MADYDRVAYMDGSHLYFSRYVEMQIEIMLLYLCFGIFLVQKVW